MPFCEHSRTTLVCTGDRCAYHLMSMRAASPIRRAAVFFCVVLVLLAALIPSGSSLPLAVLVTLCFFVPVATLFSCHTLTSKISRSKLLSYLLSRRVLLPRSKASATSTHTTV